MPGWSRYPNASPSENIDRLNEFDFVFVSVDDGPARLLIVDWLSAKGIAYVDCGMGLERSVVGLSGFVRITGADRRAFDDNVGTVRLPTENPRTMNTASRPKSPNSMRSMRPWP